MASASVLSPSVTATYRMLSPNRASRSDRVAAHPAAARVQVATCSTTRGSLTCPATVLRGTDSRSEEHTSELQSQSNLVCRLLLEKKKQTDIYPINPNT